MYEEKQRVFFSETWLEKVVLKYKKYDSFEYDLFFSENQQSSVLISKLLAI